MKKYQKIILILGIVILGFIIASYILVGIYRKFNPYLDRKLANQVSANESWVEIEFINPLKPEREVQQICIEMGEKYLFDKKLWSITFPDTRPIKIEVQVLDEDGNYYKFSRTATLDESKRHICFCQIDVDGLCVLQNQLPQNKVYRAMKIKSNEPVNLLSIFWRSYNNDDKGW